MKKIASIIEAVKAKECGTTMTSALWLAGYIETEDDPQQRESIPDQSAEITDLAKKKHVL